MIRQGRPAPWLACAWLVAGACLAGTGPMAAAVSTREDAAGAVDGVRDGRWGFHTGSDAAPWWQVLHLDEAEVYAAGDPKTNLALLKTLVTHCAFPSLAEQGLLAMNCAVDSCQTDDIVPMGILMVFSMRGPSYVQ